MDLVVLLALALRALTPLAHEGSPLGSLSESIKMQTKQVAKPMPTFEVSIFKLDKKVDKVGSQIDVYLRGLYFQN